MRSNYLNFYLARGMTHQVSGSLLASGQQLSFTLIPSCPKALEFYCQCGFGFFDFVAINSFVAKLLRSLVLNKSLRLGLCNNLPESSFMKLRSKMYISTSFSFICSGKYLLVQIIRLCIKD